MKTNLDEGNNMLESKSDIWTRIAIDLPDSGEEGIIKIIQLSTDMRAKNDHVYGANGSNSGSFVKDMPFNQDGEFVENSNVKIQQEHANLIVFKVHNYGN